MDLLLGGVAVGVSVVEGSEFILAVVLDSGGGSNDWDRGRGSNGERSGVNWGGNGQRSSLMKDWSSNGLDEGCLNSMENRLSNERMAGDNPDGGGCGQNGWALGDGDGLDWCQWNSVAGLNG